jgi:hypothetical protein
MIDCQRVELHSVLFLAGKNHGAKIQAGPDVKLQWDQAEKELHVTWNNETAILPSSSVQCRVHAKEKALVAPTPTPEGRKIVAQASSPQDHVHAGPGQGKVRE